MEILRFNLVSKTHSRPLSKCCQKNSKQILFQNGLTDSDNDSINLYTFGGGIFNGGEKVVFSRRLTGISDLGFEKRASRIP